VTTINRMLMALGLLLAASAAQAQNCAPNPYSLTNGAAADATQVMANFNNLLNCVNTIMSAAGLQGAIGGVGLSNDSGSPNTVLDIAAGSATASSSAYIMTLSGAYTKSTAAWAVGSGNGALDTGSVAASTWYHVFLIARSDTGVVDILFSINATAPTMPTSYSYKRRLGSFRTDASSHILAFTQHGDEFDWTKPTTDQNAVDIAFTLNTLTLASVPTGVVVNALFVANISKSSATPSAAIIPLTETGTTTWNMPPGRYNLTVEVAGGNAVGEFNIPTNANQQIGAYASGGDVVLNVVTHGWIDTRGKNN